MTYGKLKLFRRDRLYASDRERLNAYSELLKKNRINDDQQMCATCFGGNYGTAHRTGGKNNTDHKGSSPSKISPTKTTNNQGTKFNESSHSNNGQVMTQISAIYAKRSRSILNQFGQSNVQHAHNNQHHGTSNPVYLNPNSNINQGRGSVGNQNNNSSNNNNNQHNHDSNIDHSHNKGSPRLGRLRGISP